MLSLNLLLSEFLLEPIRTLHRNNLKQVYSYKIVIHCNLTGIIAFCLQSMDFILMDVVVRQRRNGLEPKNGPPKKNRH